MRKLIVAGMMFGALLAGAVPVVAQQRDCPGVNCQGGVGDPLTLAASGILIPFPGGATTVTTLQVASPVSDNPNAHMFFFAADCTRIPISVGIPLTTNDIAFQPIVSLGPPPTFVPVGQPSDPVPPGTAGLIALAQSDITGFALRPLDDGHPLHARVYAFSPTDGRSRIFEPIILNTAEHPSPAHWWSPLRTGGDFFAPLQTTQVQTDLALICPTNTIQGGDGQNTGQAFGNGRIALPGGPPFTDTGFPGIEWEFPAPGVTNNIRVLVYDTKENPKRDLTITCSCFSLFEHIQASIHPIYADPAEVPDGTYTEIVSAPAVKGVRTTFTGYTSIYTVGSPINAFFGRFNNGSQASIGPLQGVLQPQGR